MKSIIVCLTICTFFIGFCHAQNIPVDRVLSHEELPKYLTKEVRNKLKTNGAITEQALAKYFREKFSERFFYDWKTFSSRFKEYEELYSNESSHAGKAEDHMSKFSDSTQWVLPMKYLTGGEVNAYAIRHLARQHKMVDIAFEYFYNNKDPKYVQYFINQRNSLNSALEAGAYEKVEDGNGVYEVFRSGYRILNWLRIHNMLLGEEHYSDQDQLVTIATLLQHGADLYENNGEFRPGNHQTRGMSALAMLAILFRDFQGTDAWYDRAMKRLGEHLEMEINKDGFQFERSVHYHISDIENYFYVYQLAKNSQMKIDEAWSDKLKSLFTTLTKIGYPDKSAPVLQDDTDDPWAEKNEIATALSLGYLLFEDPVMGYFANDKVEEGMYWFISENQLQLLDNIDKDKPGFKSVDFPETGYYIMREGWDEDDMMMIISAGLDAEKPDHQHGDMLGIQAMAYGKVLLPNYQVRYSLNDLELFKNSLVKNVALVDDILQGRDYSSNKGGSGFGKFKKLPNPRVITWQSGKDLEVFIGSHDGFKDAGVDYTRQVIYINHDFWIVKDNFKSDKPHDYKQVWQGHYTFEHQPDLLRATFDDATGFDILQLKKVDSIYTGGSRGKEWNVIVKKDEVAYSFITVLYPYSGYSDRLDENAGFNEIKNWELNNPSIKVKGENAISLSQNDEMIFFDTEGFSLNEQEFIFSNPSDVYIKRSGKTLYFQSLNDQPFTLTQPPSFKAEKQVLNPGDSFSIDLLN